MQIDMFDEDRVCEYEVCFMMLEYLVDYDDDLMEVFLEDIVLDCEMVFVDFVCEMQDGLICLVFFGLVEYGNGVGRLFKVLCYEVFGVGCLCVCLLQDQVGQVVQVFKILYIQYGGKVFVVWVLDGCLIDG